MVYQGQIKLSGTREGEMRDITAEVTDILNRSGIKTGLAHIFHVGSTGAVGTVEFEPGLRRDLPELLSRLIPASICYGHEQAWHDGNGHSHLQATLLGPSLTVPVTDGELVLGTWQQAFFMELDVKPRSRTIVVTVCGDE